MKNRDPQTQALSIGGLPVPLGGEQGGESARITFGAQNTVSKGISNTIASRVSQRDAVLTVICREEDDTHKALLRIHNTRDVLPAGGEKPLPVVAANISAGLIVEAQDCAFLEVGDFVLGEAVGTVSWVISLDNATRVATRVAI